ncbi:EAL domain-containing protein [Conyzicola sp.]|uniref:EAL domain-containing protein n=1 Tax=Conyzicola sp. TaxID=1969404 RepID=UPI003989D463
MSKPSLAPNAALADGRVEMFMQPIVDLVTGRPSVFEALARLRRPDGSLATAAEFVPSLDSDDLDALFRIALDRSLASLAHWIGLGIRVDISVNLDPSTLGNPLCSAWVEEALHRHDIDAERLVLELLETRAIDEAEQNSTIDALHALGVRMAIDDLGSGYSTVSRLRHFDFDLIKIDASVHDGFTTAPASTLCSLSTLIALGVNVHRPSVVEGLESLDMLAVAAVLGAPLGQGYAIARPMPAAAVPAWTAQSAPLVDQHHLTTFSAVLAYHWVHGRGSAHPGNTSACPITAFLAEHNEGSPVDSWHVSQHGDSVKDTAGFGRKLSEWLAAHVAPGAGGPAIA